MACVLVPRVEVASSRSVMPNLGVSTSSIATSSLASIDCSEAWNHADADFEQLIEARLLAAIELVETPKLGITEQLDATSTLATRTPAMHHAVARAIMQPGKPVEPSASAALPMLEALEGHPPRPTGTALLGGYIFHLPFSSCFCDLL
ncbi:hypothetical protein ABBQ38_011982 [Trebouxia sp. C0009 RCD-2024]